MRVERYLGATDVGKQILGFVMNPLLIGERMFQSQHFGGKFLVLSGAIVIVAAVSMGAIAQVSKEQPLPGRPSFEVASVRIHDPNDSKARDNYQAYPGGRFTSSNASLWMLIHYAFQLQPYQIPDLPKSIKSEHYDVDAKPAEADANFDNIPLRLQGLLEDRFQLKYHWETRELPIYSLVVIKSGKLRASILKSDCPPPLANPEWLLKMLLAEVWRILLVTPRATTSPPVTWRQTSPGFCRNLYRTRQIWRAGMMSNFGGRLSRSK
jgi:hypothetical protein